MSLFFGLVFGLLSPLGAVAESPKDEPTVVPLDQIWAWEMPGTRNIRRLDEDGKRNEALALISAIGEASINRVEDLKRTDMPRPGFAVVGAGLEALRAAHRVMAEKKEPRSTFNPDDEITVVFFSEPAGGYKVQIRKVERRGNVKVVYYGLQLYYQRNITRAFALIPLGTLPSGKYDVKPELLAAERLKKGAEEFSTVLCKPFSFEVVIK